MKFTKGFLRLSSSGKFVGVLKYKDPEGRWRQITRTFTESYTESERMLGDWRTSMGCGNSSTASRTTVENIVRSTLNSQLARGRIERSTYDAQIACVERHLIPALGQVPLAELETRAIQEWIDELCLSVSRGTARGACSVFAKTLKAATRKGLIEHNPMNLVELPARKAPSRSYLQPDQTVKLLEAVSLTQAPDSILPCAVRLALFAGLRAGECCGLRWRDIDFNSRIIRISKSIGRSNAGCYLKGPKSSAGARDIPIVEPLASSLKAHERKKSKPSWFVCGTADRFTDPRRLSCEFKDLCEREGITDSEGKRATFHSLRRTFATEALRAGVDARTLADMMGHANAEITLNVYTGSSADARTAAATRLESAFAETWS